LNKNIVINKFNKNLEQKEEILESNQGLGLGLKVSNLIVSNYNGIIDYSSEPKKGSIFFFTFDLLDANNKNARQIKEGHKLD